MSDSRRPSVYICPHLETCVYPIDEAHFHSHCREYSESVKHPQYEQCQGYPQMNDLPRNWNERLYKDRQDTGMQRSRKR